MSFAPPPEPTLPARHPRLGLGARLTLLNALVFLGMFAVLAALAREMVRSALTAAADHVLEGELAELAGRVDLTRETHDVEGELEEYLAEEAEESRRFGLAYRIGRVGGKTICAQPVTVWAGVEPASRDAAIRRATVRPSGGGVLRVISSAHDVEDTGRFRLEVAYDLAPSEALVAGLTHTILLALPVAALLAGALGHLLARRALVPLREIEAAARGVTARSSGERIPRSFRGDELDALAQVLNAMLDRLDAALAANERFAADAAHEFRTPLQALTAELELAREEPTASAALSRAEIEVERLTALVRDLLALARSDQTTTAPARERIAIDALLVEIVEDMRPLGEERGVLLSVGALATCWVWGDRAALRRLFGNLLENACLYADPGPVKVLAGTRDTLVEVSIEDSGPGLPDEERKRLFERFFRGSRGRERNPAGTGLGLAIAAATVRTHGGSIEASPLRGGTAFRVTLPLAR